MSQQHSNGSTRAVSTTEKVQIGVIGGGAWGTALAMHCTRAGHASLVWALEADVVRDINDPAVRENSVYLKGHKLPEGLAATGDIQELVKRCAVILMVVPTPFVERTLAPLKDQLRPEQIIVSCTKGILNDSLETTNQILQRVLPTSFRSRLAYLSGPSFAAEVAGSQPSAVTIAAEDADVAHKVQKLLSTPRFRCYTTQDVAGVELGGALKNVLAIACGISDGLGFGHNARAALITRGLAEMTRLAVALGAHPLTCGGLSGMGDLVLTCTGDLSRNRTVGLRLGKGESLQEITGSTKAVAEGILTSRAAHDLAAKLKVDTPIIDGIFRVVHQGADPVAVVTEVMSRSLRSEVDDNVMAAAQAASCGS